MQSTRDPDGSKLAQLALARGRITSAQLKDARDELTQRPEAHLGEVLVARGAMSEAMLRQLMRELAGRTPSLSLVRSKAPSRPPSKPPASPPDDARVGETAGNSDEIDAIIEGVEEVEPLPERAVAPAPPAPRLVAHVPVAIEVKAPALSPDLAAKLARVRSERFGLRATIDLYLADAEKKGASDLHLHAGLPLMMRVHGNLMTANQKALDSATIEAALLAILPDDKAEQLLTTNDVDLAYVTTSGLRTRANVYRQQSGVDGVFRLLPRRAPTLSELELPEELAKFTHFHSGLVLVTGPAGCGKSTTLHALVDRINEERDDHVLTIEDPIEILHESKRCLVNQRQVKRDTESFSRALRGALREDPDVIVIGELRDLETISLAISAAETGHLVIGSLHTNGAARTLARVLDVFPARQQAQIRAMVSESLRGVISQKLLPTVDGKRTPALEVLVSTPAVANLIRDDKMHLVRSAMQMGRAQGMRVMDDSIRELVQSGRVNAEVAKGFLENPAALDPPAAAPNPTKTLQKKASGGTLGGA